MHIPDGYLSPQTTVPALAGMVPVWAAALRRVHKRLGERRIPTLALCAAFAFVVMMFNVPVAGGSSAHAVGAVFIAVLLGPWAACVSVSAALLIQALVFGDGGILAFGVNCFNMAVVMPFAGYGLYRLIAGRAALGSSRSLAGAAAGSYFGLNLAALCAAVEFGVQPLLFHTAGGAALYCPYPLSVSVPAMLFAHGLVAGPVEAVLTAAAVAYAAKFASGLFAQPAAQGAPQGDSARRGAASFWRRYRALLIPLLALFALTPLGLLASGTAFGEYGVAEIGRVFGYVPKGMAAMAEKWNALLPDYSLPAWGGGVGSVAGYLLSAAVGILLILGLILLFALLTSKLQKGKRESAGPHGS